MRRVQWFVCLSRDPEGVLGHVYLRDGGSPRKILELRGPLPLVLAGARLAVIRAVPFRVAAALLADGFLGDLG
jgi:hypothetical protein